MSLLPFPSSLIQFIAKCPCADHLPGRIQNKGTKHFIIARCQWTLFCLHWVSLLRFSPLILPDAHSPLVFSSWPSLGVFLRVFLPCFLWGLPAMPPLGAGVPQGPMLNLQLSPLAHMDPFSSLGDSPACFCLQTCISRASDLLLSPRFVCSAAC